MRQEQWKIARVFYARSLLTEQRMIDSLVLIFLKRGTHLGLNAIKIQKKISLALLTQVGT